MPDTYKKLIAAQLTPDFRAAAEIVEEPMPEPGLDQILIRNLYAGVNATDVNITAGRYAPGAQPPLDLGAEAAGEVVATGKSVKRFSEGDHVVTSTMGGGYREYHLAKAHNAVPVPEASPEALSIMVSGITASIALEEVGDLASGETVLVTAAAGGTGQYAVQLAKQAGNHVVGTCGSAEKADLLRSLGCDRPINYREEDVAAVLHEEYPDGIDLIYESVGGELFDMCVEALAIHGRLLIIGYVSEYVSGVAHVEQPRIYTKLLPRSASLRAFFLPQFAKHFQAHVERLLQMQKAGDLHVAIDETEFRGVESVVDAVEYLHSGQSRGKVIVRFG